MIKIKRLFITLSDVGIYRIHLRFRYELKKIYNRLFIKFFFEDNDSPELINNLLKKQLIKKPYKNNNIKFINFDFLNEKKLLALPFNWNNQSWQRLWQFNLHYFDWGRELLEYRLRNDKWSDDADKLEVLIDQWISNNKLGVGDGWHSYTLSLRIRNWIWFFNICPDLLNKRRKNSLWNQMLWLINNPEKCHGGNHWLENLISISFASLHWKNEKADFIHRKYLGLLEEELNLQILPDGGHEERSFSYHCLLLDRLIELGFVIKLISNEHYYWLMKVIVDMTLWIYKVKFRKSKFPRFNDSASNDLFNHLEIIEFANSFLLNTKMKGKGFRSFIANNINNNCEIKSNIDVMKLLNFYDKLKSNLLKEQPSIFYLNQTGWVVIKNILNWDLAFKNGICCPSHLGAHAHSDLLSFELYYDGEPFFAEYGTSTYEKGNSRKLERSSSAHNSCLLGKQNSNEIKWFEPIDTWSVFRVGKKALPVNRDYGKDQGWYWSVGEHNGYKEIGALHKRYIAITQIKNKLIFVLIDIFSVREKCHVKSWLHNGPRFEEIRNKFDLNLTEWSSLKDINKKKYESYLSNKFGERQKRCTRRIIGKCEKGNNLLIRVLSPQNIIADFSNVLLENGSIKIGDEKKISWQQINSKFIFS